MAKQRKKRPETDEVSTPTPKRLKLTLPARPKPTKTATTSLVAVEVDKQPNHEPANPASQLVPASVLPVSKCVTVAPAVSVSQPVPEAPSLPTFQATPVAVTKPTALASALNHLNDEEIDQEIEILTTAAIPYPQYQLEALGRLFTLDDSQDESEISTPKMGRALSSATSCNAVTPGLESTFYNKSRSRKVGGRCGGRARGVGPPSRSETWSVRRDEYNLKYQILRVGHVFSEG
jgi:hypothetical protein